MDLEYSPHEDCKRGSMGRSSNLQIDIIQSEQIYGNLHVMLPPITQTK